MKIGIDCRMFNLKFGIGRYTHELVANISALNNQLQEPHELVFFFNNPEFDEFECAANTRKVLVDAPHYSWSEQTKFLKALNAESPDIMHFPHFNFPVRYKGPYVVTIHDIIISIYPEKPIRKFHKHLAYRFAIKNAVKKAKKVITVSNNTAKDVQESLKVPAEKTEAIHLGVNPEFKPSDDPSATLSKFNITKPFILHTGVWRRHKNAEKLIEAFRKIKEAHDIQIVFTSPPNPDYSDTDVIFTDKVSEKELVDLYTAAAIFAFPSLYEGFGLPPLEAMACGTPVAVARASSIPEVCGDAALYFDPTSTADITDKITQLYESPELQQEFIQKGLAHAAKFSWERMAERTFKIILTAAQTT